MFIFILRMKKTYLWFIYSYTTVFFWKGYYLSKVGFRINFVPKQPNYPITIYLSIFVCKYLYPCSSWKIRKFLFLYERYVVARSFFFIILDSILTSKKGFELIKQCKEKMHKWWFSGGFVKYISCWWVKYRLHKGENCLRMKILVEK